MSGIGGHSDLLWCVGEDTEQSPALQRHGVDNDAVVYQIFLL